MHNFNLDHIGAPAFLVEVKDDGQFRYSDINAVNEKWSGFTRGDLKGRAPDDLFTTDAAACLVEHYTRCVMSGRPVDYEGSRDLPIGLVNWHTFLTPLTGPDGRIDALLGVCVDAIGRHGIERSSADRRIPLSSDQNPIAETKTQRIAEGDHPPSIVTDARRATSQKASQIRRLYENIRHALNEACMPRLP